MALIQQIQYSTHFNTKQFLQTWHSTLENNRIAIFRLKQRHKFFQSYSSKWNGTNARMLEFGGGPTILDHISAAPHVAAIVHTVYTGGERNEIQMCG